MLAGSLAVSQYNSSAPFSLGPGAYTPLSVLQLTSSMQQFLVQLCFFGPFCHSQQLLMLLDPACQWLRLHVCTLTGESKAALAISSVPDYCGY